MEVSCDVEYMALENDSGHEIDSVGVTCSRCHHEVQSYGDGAVSVRRCLAVMREECPKHEQNWYFVEGGEDED